MSEVIDNRSKLLGDDLKKELKEGTTLRVVASYFSIYAFETLKEELSNIKELQFIFPSPTFVSEGIKGTVKKEAKEFYIPKQMRENSLYGTEFEIRLRNKMTQRTVARECAEWVKDAVTFKSNISNGELQNFIYLDNGEKKITYAPINGFTAVDLGYERNNSVYQFAIKEEDENFTRYFLEQFKDVWNDPERLEDVTQSVVDYIANAYKENSPEFIYFVILYNIFKEFLDDIMSEDYMPNEATGYKDSIVWNKLYAFQRDGAVGVINKLEKYNGCILADSVGLGKTFTALAVMKYYASRNKNILVLTPKKLSNNWNQYKDNLRTNLFYNDHIRFDVLYHTDLGRKKGFSNGIDLSLFNWDNYDLVVIDESHNFRNAFKYKNHETRYDFLINKVLKSGVRTKVLMLSATPVNNRFTDLKNQLQLAYGDNIEDFNSKLDTVKTVNEILINAQRAFNDWAKLPQEQRSSKSLMDALDVDFSILLDNVTIARSRKHITKYYDMSEIGNFPTRLKPKSFYTDIAKDEDTIGYNDLYTTLMNLTMSVYAPTNYIFPSKADKYIEMYKTVANEGRATFVQSDREKALQKLMTVNMLKRLESCVDSFRITVKNIKNMNEETLGLIDEYEKNKANGIITKSIKELSYIDENDLDDEDFEIGSSETIGKIKIDFADMDLRAWKNDLQHDINELSALYDIMSWITPEKDLKLQKLKEIIDEKIANPINEGNKKFLIFSAFADTTNYLYKNIADYVFERYGLHSARIQGAIAGNATNVSGNRDTDRLLTLFSPISKEKDKALPNETQEIDMLIATDCVSEGQNLQDCDICINYDIHWNPVRIVQRFGRIDRIGSKNKFIQLVNFWPNVSLDEYIKLNKRVTSRMSIVNATATGDDNVLKEEEVDLDYRAVQLKKLQEGELQDLEDVDGSVTITDLGLNEFRMDMVDYIKKHGEPGNIPNGLYAVVPEDESKGVEKGIVFVLRNRNEGINIDKQNRLHPYYLVYLNKDGEPLIDHMEPKKVLDILRTTCKHQYEPIMNLCRAFNKETNDGYKMDKYSDLLKATVKTIIHKEEQNDLMSLFSSGSDVLWDNTLSGLDDFELISFVVVK